MLNREMALAAANESNKKELGSCAEPQEPTGCYVYCVTQCRNEESLGSIGVESQEVHTVVYRDLSALVHLCPEPYRAADGAAAAWVMAHHRVVETAWERWGTVLPLAFNTIIAGGDQGAEDKLRAWLVRDYNTLAEKLGALRGKAEYGVQVFWDPLLVAPIVSQESREIRRLEEETKSLRPGLAYMYRQKLEKALLQEMELRAVQQCQELYVRLSSCAERVHAEKTKEAQGDYRMIANLSCLVSQEHSSSLKALVEEVSTRKGYSARLVGPLPPYSFC